MKNNRLITYQFLTYVGGNEWMFYLLSFTWGIIASLIGFIILIPFLITKRFEIYNNRLYGVFPKCFGDGWGFEMGCFFYVSHDCYSNEKMNIHESGHGLQNIVWGPLMIFVISIPSMIRFWYRKYLIKKGKEVKPYESIWFEKQASQWGLNFIHLTHKLRIHK